MNIEDYFQIAKSGLIVGFLLATIVSFIGHGITTLFSFIRKI